MVLYIESVSQLSISESGFKCPIVAYQQSIKPTFWLVSTVLFLGMEVIHDERVVRGTVKRAYPLQVLHRVSGTTSLGGGELGAFGPGVGPCGWDASQLTAVVVENHILFYYR